MTASEIAEPGLRVAAASARRLRPFNATFVAARPCCRSRSMRPRAPSSRSAACGFPPATGNGRILRRRTKPAFQRALRHSGQRDCRTGPPGRSAPIPGWRKAREAGVDAGTPGRISRSFLSRPGDDGADHGQGSDEMRSEWHLRLRPFHHRGAAVDRAQHGTCFGCHQANVRNHDHFFMRFAP